MTKQILRAVAMIVGMCVASVGLAQLATAAENYNSSRSNKTNMKVRPGPTDIVPASGITVQVTQTQGGRYQAQQTTTAGKATFAKMLDGTYAVAMSPATGPAGSVGGLSVMWTTGAKVGVACETAARKDNSFNCALNVGGGPAELTLTLLNP